MTTFDKRLTDKPSILSNIDKNVRDAWDNGEIPQDSTWAVITTVDNNGSKLVAAVNLQKTDKLNIKVKAIWEHDWDGNDTVAGKIVFSGK